LHILNLGIGLDEKINNLKVTWVNDNNKEERKKIKTLKIREMKEERTLFKRFDRKKNLAFESVKNKPSKVT